MSKIGKVLVTGGAGFLGRNLVHKLVEQDVEVVVFDNGFRVGFENLNDNPNISLVKGDVTNIRDWNLLPKDVDVAFHLAAINGTRYFYEIPDKVLSVNVQGTLNFLSWVGTTKANRIFFASSSEVYGFPKVFPTPETEPLVVPDPTNPRFSYSSSKIIGETSIINISKKIGIDFAIARFHNIYGPNMGFEHVIPEFIQRCVKNEKFTVQGQGTESRCFCYITDAIEAILNLATHDKAKNEIFNIGTDEETTIKQLINLLEQIHGKEINPLFKEFENAGTSRRVPDINKIKKLGYEPKVFLKDGLKKTYDWYADYYSKN